MSNYTQSTNFATKDALSPGDPLKIVRGTEINTEFTNIAVAVATKLDTTALASPGPIGATTPSTISATNVQMASANGGQLAGLRNKIINGDMRVAQRGTSLVIVAASSGYLLDRWLVNNDTNQSITVSQTTTTINSSDTAYRLRVAAAVAPTTGTVSIRQRIEDVSTLAGVTATISAQVASADTSMVAETSLLQNFGSGGSTSVSTTPVSFSPTASYSKVSSTHAIPSTVGKTVGANNCLEWTMLLTLRSTNAFSLTEAQLEVGPVATPFEQRPIGMELALCQYYAQPIPLARYSGYVGATQNVITKLYYPTMRATPALTGQTFGQTNATGAAVSALSLNAASFSATATAAGSFDISVLTGFLSSEL